MRASSAEGQAFSQPGGLNQQEEAGNQGAAVISLSIRELAERRSSVKCQPRFWGVADSAGRLSPFAFRNFTIRRANVLSWFWHFRFMVPKNDSHRRGMSQSKKPR